MWAQTKTKDPHLGLTFFSTKNSTPWAIKFGLYIFIGSIPAGKLVCHNPMNELDLPPPTIERKVGTLKK